MPRSGKTRAHYQKQKSQSFAYFRVDASEHRKLRGSAFSVYDFVRDSFSFSPTRKQLAVSLLQELKKRPRSFPELMKQTGARKSTLFLLCLALERSGVIERAGKHKPYSLSPLFAQTLRAYANWWEHWLAAPAEAPAKA